MRTIREFFERVKSWYNLHFSSIIFFFVCVYIIASPVVRVLPFSLNRILVAVLLGLLILRFLFHELFNPIYYFAFLFLLVVFTVTSLNSGSFLLENLIDFAYFGMTVLVFVLVMDRDLQNELPVFFKKYRPIVLIAVLLCYSLFALALLFSDSFEKDGAFRGFDVSSHSVATVSILCAVLLVAARYKLPIWYIPAGLFIYMSKARTFLFLLVPIAFIYCLVVCKKRSIGLTLFFALILVAAVIIPFTPIGDKIRSTSSGWYRNHPIDAISNGRSLMWTDCIAAFFSGDLSHILFGNSFSFVKTIIEADFGIRLWAHNDFIEMLLATGVFGLIAYLGFFSLSVYSIKGSPKRIALLLFFFTAALLNGYMLYFHLSISALILSSLSLPASSAKRLQREMIITKLNI